MWHFFNSYQELNTESEFILPLSVMKEGEYERNYVIGKEFFSERECEEVLDADVDVTLRIEYRHEHFKLLFALKGSVETPCDRCLEPLRVPVDEEFDFTVRYGEVADDSDDNVLVVDYSTRSFDVAPLIYDSILLSIPMRCVHPEGECTPGMEAFITGTTAGNDGDDEDEKD